MYRLDQEKELHSPTAILRPAYKKGHFVLGTTKTVRLMDVSTLKAHWCWTQRKRIYPSETPFLLTSGKILVFNKRSPQIRDPIARTWWPRKLSRWGFEVTHFGCSPDGRYLALCGLNRELELWNFQEERRFFEGLGGFRLQAFQPQNRCCVVENENEGVLRIFDLPSGKNNSNVRLPGGLGGSGTGHQRLAFLPKQTEFIALSGKGLVRVDWRTGSSTPISIAHKSRSANLHHQGRVHKIRLDGLMGLALSPSGEILAVSVNDDIRFFQLNTDGKLDPVGKVKQTAFSMYFPDEDHLAVITENSGPAPPTLRIFTRINDCEKRSHHS